MLELLGQADTWISLVTLSAMEIVLGIDNVVFLTILAGRLPQEQQGRARKLGLSFALLTRLGLLFAISWVMGLTRPLFSVLGREVSGRDLILLGGGLFLIAKATHEIHDKLEVEHAEERKAGGGAAFWAVIVQIALLDIVFSLDSVITAVGMAKHLPVMVAAMVLAVGVMLVFADAIGGFVERHPTIKMLALSFLILIGVMLVAEGLGKHIEKGYVYFAMAFSLGVELLNMRVRKTRQAPVHLHGRFEEERAGR
ncbi:Integral membrane protein TerC [Anaeromyxobacter dehalogenans 2CP-1]|uniref:Integral membrane protein TerC n=1 Tax=Anaeromyxobacter dehalogenans (strain ATCC BAA-258 / DSM 21875 / 2CP-1) TaxID=455488 RepID=B8J7T4_ANAD2|nr:TerC family protein [Anaeromyxobacter dehalogenans]ACL63426.1 Integral membrane protein TerC [Anaeromyxobacter dehalogenans 2CP-1]